MHINLVDQYLHRESIIHRLDPRVKVLLVMLYITAVGLLPEGQWYGFILYFLLLIIFITASEVHFFSIIKRSFVALPFILAAIAVLFTTPGTEWFKLPFVGWTISESGAIRFLSILFRAWLAVQTAIVLTMTTRVPDLFWSLSALKLPSSLVAIISFMYRYLFVLANEALRMMRARSARSPRLPNTPKPSFFWQGRVTGSMVGSLFIRSLERSERVYSAMLSRGYDGRVLILRRYKMNRIDWSIFLGISIFLFSSQIIIHLG